MATKSGKYRKPAKAISQKPSKKAGSTPKAAKSKKIKLRHRIKF